MLLRFTRLQSRISPRAPAVHKAAIKVGVDCWTVHPPLLCSGVQAAVTGRSLPANLTSTECQEASSTPELDRACSCHVHTGMLQSIPAAEFYIALQVMEHLPTMAALFASN